jgi:hypothetical protein
MSMKRMKQKNTSDVMMSTFVERDCERAQDRGLQVSMEAIEPRGSIGPRSRAACVGSQGRVDACILHSNNCTSVSPFVLFFLFSHDRAEKSAGLDSRSRHTYVRAQLPVDRASVSHSIEGLIDSGEINKTAVRADETQSKLVPLDEFTSYLPKYVSLEAKPIEPKHATLEYNYTSRSVEPP